MVRHFSKALLAERCVSSAALLHEDTPLPKKVTIPLTGPARGAVPSATAVRHGTTIVTHTCPGTPPAGCTAPAAAVGCVYGSGTACRCGTWARAAGHARQASVWQGKGCDGAWNIKGQPSRQDRQWSKRKTAPGGTGRLKGLKGWPSPSCVGLWLERGRGREHGDESDSPFERAVTYSLPCAPRRLTGYG